MSVFSGLYTNSNPSLSAQNDIIGLFTGAFLNVGAMFLSLSSLGGAFVPGCPFRSAFSSVLRFFIGIPIKRCFPSERRWIRWSWIGICIILSAAVAYFATFFGIAIYLIFFPIAMPVAYSTLQDSEEVRKSQKYKIPHLALCLFLVVSLSIIASITFGGIFFLFLSPVVMIVFLACGMVSKLSKSMADTGEIDAIAWLMTTTPRCSATFFKKAGQMTGLDSVGRHYRPRLLEPLMPLLTLLITPYHTSEYHSSDSHSPSSKPRRNFKIELKKEQSQADDVLNGRYALPTSLTLVDDDSDEVPIDEDQQLENLEIYVACLARLSEFTDYEGNPRCLWEDAMQHPKLEQPLIDKLVVFADPRRHFRVGLRSAATKVLNNYDLDMEGNPVRSSAAVLWSVATVLRSAASLMLNVSGLNTNQDSEKGHPILHRSVDPVARVEPAHLSGEIEEVKRDTTSIGDSRMC